ncbi:MAG: carbohydrate-binding family 9-like protein [Labilithrix sp.]
MLRSVALLALLSALGVACVATGEEDAATDEAMLGTCAKATTTSALNVRSAPSTDGAVLVTLDPGTTLEVIDSGAASGWAHVRANGKEGYAKASYLTCASATAKPTLHAPQIESGIVIDGTLDAAWSAASAVTFATDWSGRPTASMTTVRAIWSVHALYMLWEIEGTGLETDHSRPVNVEREGLYNEDCVELFFTPNPAEPRKYFEIELGPYGHYFDLAIDRKANTSDVRWSSGAQIATTQDPANHRAVVEVALTSPDIVVALKRGASLPINMFRMEGKGSRQYLAWSPTRTPRPSFHVPEAFGTLSLD